MPVLYIHIGTHKTGSTSIQHALCNNSQRLKDEGWIHLKCSAIAIKKLMAADKFDRSLVVPLQEQLNQSIVQVGEGHEKYILSSEGFSGYPSNGYLNADIVSEILREATRAFDVRIIVYLRRQDSFVESMYTQKIQEGESFEFENFVCGFSHPDSLNYELFLDSFAKRFGTENMLVRSYENVLLGDGLLTNFSRILGRDTLRAEDSKYNRNPSYSRSALEIARATNTALDEEQKKQLRRILQASSAKKRGDSFEFFNFAERVHFLSRFSESNERVVRKYFGFDSKQLFAEPVNVGTNHQLEGVLPAEIAQILVYMLSHEDPYAPITIRNALRRVLSGYPRFKSIIRRAIDGVRT